MIATAGTMYAGLCVCRANQPAVVSLYCHVPRAIWGIFTPLERVMVGLVTALAVAAYREERGERRRQTRGRTVWST